MHSLSVNAWWQRNGAGGTATAITRGLMDPKAAQICFYHMHCRDGALAAAFIQRAAPACVCVPAWRDEIPQSAPDITGKYVVYVDLTPCVGVLAEVLARAKDVFILDHHESVRTTLASMMRPASYRFDLKECGATLAWRWTQEDGVASSGAGAGASPPVPPEFMLYVKALDLFDWSGITPRDPDAMNVSRAIEAIVAPDVPTMLAILDSPMAMDDIRTQSVTVNRIIDAQIDRCLGSAEYYTLSTRPHTRLVVINSQHFVNWIAHRLYTTCDITLVWAWYRHGPSKKIRVMLRSNGRFNCQVYARLYGGGGHASSASFVCNSFDEMLSHMYTPSPYDRSAPF